MHISKELYANPPFTVVHCAEVILMMMANLKLLQDRILPVQKRLMLMVKAVDKRTGEPLTDPRHTYRMSRKQWEEWYEEYRHELKEMGYTQERYKNGIDPLLEAEGLLMDAHRALVLALTEYGGLTWDQLSGDPDLMDSYIELQLGWLAEHVKRKREKDEQKCKERKETYSAPAG